MFLFGWIFLSFAVAVYANRLKRNPVSWLVSSLVFSPALTWVLLLAIGPHAEDTPVIESTQTDTQIIDEPTSDDDLIYLESEEGEASFDNTKVHKAEKQLEFSSCMGSDYYYASYEFKFDGEKVYLRLLDKFTEDYKGKEEDVRDNVVLISAIKARFDASAFKIRSFEDTIAELQKEVDWHECINYKIKYRLQSMYPDIYPENELRRYFRKEYERINFAANEINNKLKEIGAVVTVEEGFTNYTIPEGASPGLSKLLTESYRKLTEQYDISEIELRGQAEVLKILDLLINPQKKKNSAA